MTTKKAKYIQRIIAEIEFSSSDKRATPRSGAADILNIIGQVSNDLEDSGRTDIDKEILAAQVAYSIKELMDAGLVKIRNTGQYRKNATVIYQSQVTLREILEAL